MSLLLQGGFLLGSLACLVVDVFGLAGGATLAVFVACIVSLR